MTITELDNLFMNDLRKSQAYQMTMAQAVIEAEERYNKEMAEIEELFPEDFTVEDLEIELASIDDYRDEVLDISVDEAEWINDNIKVSDILGDKYETHDKENVIDVLSSALKLTPAKTKRLLRTGLGIKIGSEYQNKQKKYVENLIEGLDSGLYDDLLAHLKKRKLLDFYKALLKYVSNNISLKPKGVDEDELVFFVVYGDFRKALKNEGVETGLSSTSLKNKLKILCELGLLRTLPDDCINSQQLAIANQLREKSSRELHAVCGQDVMLKRRDFYILNNLSPSVQEEAINKTMQSKKSGLKEKSKNSTSLALVYGIDEVKNNIIVQTDININKTKLRNFINAANYLLKTQGYYTEKQLRIQYMKKDKRIRKKDAIVLTATYLAGVNLRVGAVKARVNVDTREKHGIPSKIKSNSVIYIKER